MPRNNLTIRQQRTLQELPKNNYILSKSMRKAGYSEATVRSGEQYKSLRRLTQFQELYGEDAKKTEMKRLAKLERRLLKESEYTNLLRAKELKFRAAGWIKDKDDATGQNITVVNYKLQFDKDGKPIINEKEIEQQALSLTNKDIDTEGHR